MKHCDILIPGNYFCDLIFTGIPGFPALGTELYTQKLTAVPGGCLNTITALTRLGVDTGWIGALGSDPFSHVIDEWVTQEYIDRRWLLMLDQPLQRVTIALSYPKDRAFVTYVDPAPDWFDRAWQAVENEECSHLHFTGLWVDPRAPDLLKACRAHGITVTMDCQHREDTLASPLVREIVGLSDMFMPNAGEAMRLTETSSLDAAADMLRAMVPLLLIKDGGSGAQVWQGDQYFAAPAMQVEVVDTTGAGDAFNAGFLAAYRNHADLLTCLKWGNYCGGLSTTGYGGASASPTRAMVEAHFAESRS